MYYFIVNNDFHLDVIEQYKAELHAKSYKILAVPHRLSSKRQSSSIDLVVNTPFRSRAQFWNPINFYRAYSVVKKIGFAKGDKVIALTEYDPLNQAILFWAKTHGANTYILEEGIATYYTCAAGPSDDLTVRNKIKLAYIRWVVGFWWVNFYKKGDGIYPQIQDRFLDAFLLQRKCEVSRCVDVVNIHHCYEPIASLNRNASAFLSQPLYESFVTEAVYLSIFETVLRGMVVQYDKVYVRPHPRDSEYVRERMREIALRIGCDYVDGNASLAEFFGCNKIGVAASFFSDSLFKLDLQGVQVVFLYSLFGEIGCLPVIGNVDKVLALAGYIHPKSVSSGWADAGFLSNSVMPDKKFEW